LLGVCKKNSIVCLDKGRFTRPISGHDFDLCWGIWRIKIYDINGCKVNTVKHFSSSIMFKKNNIVFAPGSLYCLIFFWVRPLACIIKILQL